MENVTLAWKEHFQSCFEWTLLTEQVIKTECLEYDKFWIPDSTHPPIDDRPPKKVMCGPFQNQFLEFWTGFDPPFHFWDNIMKLPLFWGASLIRRVSRGSEALRVGGAREDGRREEKPGVIEVQCGQQHSNIVGQRDFTKGDKGHLFWHLQRFLLKVSFCRTSSFPQNSNWALSFPQK